MEKLMRFLGQFAHRSPWLCQLAVRFLPNPLKLLTLKTYERWLLVIPVPGGSITLNNDLNIVDQILKSHRNNFPKSALLQPLIGGDLFGQGGGPNVKAKRNAYCPSARSEAAASGCLDHAARLRLSLYLSPASGAEAN